MIQLVYKENKKTYSNIKVYVTKKVFFTHFIISTRRKIVYNFCPDPFKMT